MLSLIVATLTVDGLMLVVVENASTSSNLCS